MRDGISEAFQDALRWLAIRPRTEHELRERLIARDCPAAESERILLRLRDAGYVDDARLAYDYIVTRAERLGHGPQRLLGDLGRRGVTAEVGEAALALAQRDGALALPELLGRRLRRKLRGRAESLNPQAYARVYNALLREGFDAEDVRRALAAAGGTRHDDFA